ncbi:hypothetical protein OAK45_03460 [Verrucomicrobia bacterium]|nr:hypothetical protein [Verrucomicrobiota bacterium]
MTDPKGKPKPKSKAQPAEALPAACNVVDCSSGRQQFWRFTGSKNQMKLVDVRETESGEKIPDKHLDRDASQMWRAHCQNDAWLPADKVFFRVLHLPLCNARELPGMVEMQLEKVSPLPLGRAVWSFEVVPVHRADREQQTVVVMLAERAEVEECVGELEKAGYFPDRLEAAVIHQVMATPQGGERPDGAWIYPRFLEERVVCTVAWWDEGVLQNITQIILSSAEHLNELTEQLTAATWAMEMEGLLTGSTHWHLVIASEHGEQWLPTLNEWAGQGVEIKPPPDASALAAACATRAERPLEQGNLMPPERRADYHRRDVDRVLGGILSWMLLLYGMLLVGYFVLNSQTADREEAKYQQLKKMKAMEKEVGVLVAKRNLLVLQRNSRMTALQVLKEVAEQMPEELSLGFINSVEVRGEGNNITLNGEVKSGQGKRVDDYRNNLARIMVTDPVSKKQRKLFHEVATTDSREGAAGVEGPGRWTIVCMIRPNTPLK